MGCRCPGIWVSLSLAAALGAAMPAGAGEDAAAKAYLADDLAGAEKLLEAEIAGGEARPSRYLFLGSASGTRRT